MPAIVTAQGGPQSLIVPRVTGFAATTDEEFVQAVLGLVAEPRRMQAMGAAARQNILTASWDTAFEMVYSAYRFCQDAAVGVQRSGSTSALAQSSMPAA